MRRIFPIILFLLISLIGYSQGDYSYKRYLKESSLSKQLSEYYYEDTLSKKDINDIILKCNEFTFESFQYQKTHLLYIAYDAAGNVKKASKCLSKMIVLGKVMLFTSDSAYINSMNIDSLIGIRKNNRNQKIYTFFKEIESELYTTEDSMNYELNKEAIPVCRRKIDSFINTYDSWIGYDIRGTSKYFGRKFRSNIDLIAWSMDEITLNNYYNIIRANCKKNNEDWRMAVGLKYWQFKYGQYGDSLKFTKLRGVEITPEGLNFEDDNTLLTINALARYCMNMSSGKKVRINPTELWGGSDYNDYLLSLMDKLIELGVDYNDIIIENKLIPLDKNEKLENDYFFVFELVQE